MRRTSLILAVTLLSLPLLSCKEDTDELQSEIQQRDHAIAKLQGQIEALQKAEVEVSDPQQDDSNNQSNASAQKNPSNITKDDSISELEKLVRALTDRVETQEKTINQLNIALQKEKTPVVHHKPKDHADSDIKPKVTENNQDTQKQASDSNSSPEGDPQNKHAADHQSEDNNTTPDPKSIHDTQEEKQPERTTRTDHSARPVGFHLASPSEKYVRQYHASDYYKVLLAQNIPGYMDRTWQMSLEVCFNRRNWLFKKDKDNRYFIIFTGLADQVFADAIPELSTGHEVTIIWECDPKDKSIRLDHVQFENAKLHGELKRFYQILAEAR